MNLTTFFNPQGRVSKAQFLSATLVLIGLGFVIALFPAVLGPGQIVAAGVVTFFVQIVAMYCWVALWIKRLHQGGQSGWMTVLIVMAWIVVSTIASVFVVFALSPDLMSLVTSGADPTEIMQYSEESSRRLAIPGGIISALMSLAFVFGLNAVLPNHEGDNAFGPPPT